MTRWCLYSNYDSDYDHQRVNESQWLVGASTATMTATTTTNKSQRLVGDTYLWSLKMWLLLWLRKICSIICLALLFVLISKETRGLRTPLQTVGFKYIPLLFHDKHVPFPVWVRCWRVRLRVEKKIPEGYPCHALVPVPVRDKDRTGPQNTTYCRY